MTKYEYKHNKEHKEIIISGGVDFYSTPRERIILIILINGLIITLPFILVYTRWYWWGLIVVGLLTDLFMWTEYNIFYNLERTEYFFYSIFGKKTVYKQWIEELEQYENVVKYENKLGFKLRKSYINCKKIVFSNKKNYGYIKDTCILINGKKEFHNINEFKKISELINFIKNKKIKI